MPTLTAKELRAARKARLAAARGLDVSTYDDELDTILAEIDEELSLEAELDELEAEIEAELDELEGSSYSYMDMDDTYMDDTYMDMAPSEDVSVGDEDEEEDDDDEEEEEEEEEEDEDMSMPMNKSYMGMPEVRGKGYSGLGHGKGAGYYPSTTKPTELNPETSRNTGGLYHYYGPPPDFGGSYGSTLTAMLIEAKPLSRKQKILKERLKRKHTPGKRARRKTRVKMHEMKRKVQKGVGKGKGKFLETWRKMSAGLKKSMGKIKKTLKDLSEEIKKRSGPAKIRLKKKAVKLRKKLKGLKSDLSKAWKKMKKKHPGGAALKKSIQKSKRRMGSVEEDADTLDLVVACLGELYDIVPDVREDFALTAETSVDLYDIELPESVNKLFAKVRTLANDLIKSAEWLNNELETGLEANIHEDDDMSNVVAVLADTVDLEDITDSDVHMALFNAESENPHWNVSIRGIPVAAIYLADQPDTPEVRAMFVDNAYANAITEGITRAPGLNDVLDAVNAKRFASVMENTTLAQQIRAEVKSELDSEYAEKIAETDENFLRCMSITLAGMQKNFFPARNSLKESLYSEMKKAGVMDPTRVIEDAFANGGVEFFEAAVAKTRELMDTPPEAVVAIANAIGDSQVQLPDAVEENLTEGYSAQSMAERMASNSVPFQTYGDLDTNGQSFRERAERLLRFKNQ